MQTFEYQLKMTCTGCSGAVTRILSKNPSIAAFNVDLEAQRVRVSTADLSKDQVLAIIQKSGKETVAL
jgi:copper chaperone